LGIPSEERQHLQTQTDYNELFSWYEKTILPNRSDQLQELLLLNKQYNRIAITCFEACVDQCHRGRVAKAIAATPGWDIPITHL
jgi:uncharacterized protein (DUF488 family)